MTFHEPEEVAVIPITEYAAQAADKAAQEVLEKAHRVVFIGKLERIFDWVKLVLIGLLIVMNVLTLRLLADQRTADQVSACIAKREARYLSDFTQAIGVPLAERTKWLDKLVVDGKAYRNAAGDCGL